MEIILLHFLPLSWLRVAEFLPLNAIRHGAELVPNFSP